MGHPTMPDTQLVVIPPQSDVQSIIQALTARGKEKGGPNKFILISGTSPFNTQAKIPVSHIKETENVSLLANAPNPSQQHTVEDSNKAEHREGGELDVSLTNIHWLGEMSSDGFGPGDEFEQRKVKEEPEETDIERLDLEIVKVEEESENLPGQPRQISTFERPPYSYMALIQFAINSTAGKRMTLKDIYNWIEDHFPYFKHVAKPGWKNSIRHNLSLHDMFVRETEANNKISYWTIHPQANRYLTMDQVFKQKRAIPELNKNTVPCSSIKERKMKPLLPRVNSYLIPVQFPVTQPVLLPALETFTADPGPSDGPQSVKRVKIAPKVPLNNEEPPALPPPVSIKEEINLPDLSSPPIFQCKRASGSRRKQQLFTPRAEESELVLPESSCADSGLDTDFSFLQDTQSQEGPSQHTQEEECTFKTPIKERLSNPPASSTPRKEAETSLLQHWESDAPFPRDSLLDVSPVRIPRGPALTPFKDSLGALCFGETPFKDLPIFGSPQNFLGTFSPTSPSVGTPESPTGVRPPMRCSKELQVGGPVNRSLLEGLVLDTVDESLSKILLDVSFSSIEGENGAGADSLYWSQFLSEFR
ncbi:forkhead box protein M1 [Rhinophrynus dorsalis]